MYNEMISWIAYAIVAMLIQQEQLCSRKNKKMGMEHKESKER